MSVSIPTANTDFIAVSNTLHFPSGSSPPFQQCTDVSIVDDFVLEDEFETIPLTAIFLNPNDIVTFTQGGSLATIIIQDDDSE